MLKPKVKQTMVPAKYSIHFSEPMDELLVLFALTGGTPFAEHRTPSGPKVGLGSSFPQNNNFACNSSTLSVSLY